MESEALRGIRTMRRIKSSLDLARLQKLKTTNDLSKTGEEAARLQSLEPRHLGQLLARERKRFAAFQASRARSRQRLLKSRERMAEMLVTNQKLTKLRLELQQACWQGTTLKSETRVAPGKKFREVDINY